MSTLDVFGLSVPITKAIRIRVGNEPPSTVELVGVSQIGVTVRYQDSTTKEESLTFYPWHVVRLLSWEQPVPQQ